MYKLDDPRQATPEQRLRFCAAPLALLLAATLITGCQSSPTLPEAKTSTGCVPMNPASAYAVYWGKDKVEAVEEIPSGLQRCVVAVAQAPSAPASPPAAAPAPSCTNGQTPSPAAAYVVDYYKGEPNVPLQIEDLRGVLPRCITRVRDTAGGSECPPPAAHHKVLINGVVYCVPN